MLDTFPFRNTLQQGDALSPLLFYFSFRMGHHEGVSRYGES